MDREKSKGSVGSSSLSKTTSSGTSSSRGDFGTSGTHTTTTSGSSKTTSTIDPSHIIDGTANLDIKITESDDNQLIFKQRGKFDLMTKIAMIFQLVLWGGISILAYIAFKPLYSCSVSPIIASSFNPKIDL